MEQSAWNTLKITSIWIWNPLHLWPLPKYTYVSISNIYHWNVQCNFLKQVTDSHLQDGIIWINILFKNRGMLCRLQNEPIASRNKSFHRTKGSDMVHYFGTSTLYLLIIHGDCYVTPNNLGVEKRVPSPHFPV